MKSIIDIDDKIRDWNNQNQPLFDKDDMITEHNNLCNDDS